MRLDIHFVRHFIVVIISSLFSLAAGTITCQIDTPDRDECIKEAIQDMLPKLVVSENLWKFMIKIILHNQHEHNLWFRRKF